MKKKIIIIMSATVVATSVYAASCFVKLDCTYGNFTYQCIQLPSSVTTGTPQGESDPHAYAPLTGLNCGTVWEYYLPTGEGCGGPPIGDSCV